MDRRQWRLARELVGVAGGQAMSAVGSLVGLRLLTGAMGPREFGILALALTAPLFLGNVLFAGPGQAVMRFYTAAWDSAEGAPFLVAAWRAMWWRTAGLLLVALVCLVGAVAITGTYTWLPLATAALVNGILTASGTVLDGFQNALRHRFTVAWHAALGVWLRFGAALALFRFFSPSGVVALWGYTVATAVVLCSQFGFYYWHLRSTKAPPLSGDPSATAREWHSRIERFSWPFSVFGIVAWLQSASERWSLQAFATTATVGEYAALSQLGLGLTALLANVMLQLGLPIFYQRAGSGADPKAVRAAHRLNLLFLLMTAGATLVLVAVSLAFHRQIMRLTVSREFLGVSHLLPIMMLSGGVLACAQVASGFLLTSTESHRLILPKALSSVAGAGGMILGARWAGIVGVVWASVVASALHMILVLFSSRAAASRRIEPKKNAMSPMIQEPAAR